MPAVGGAPRRDLGSGVPQGAAGQEARPGRPGLAHDVRFDLIFVCYTSSFGHRSEVALTVTFDPTRTLGGAEFSIRGAEIDGLAISFKVILYIC